MDTADKGNNGLVASYVEECTCPTGTSKPIKFPTFLTIFNNYHSILFFFSFPKDTLENLAKTALTVIWDEKAVLGSANVTGTFHPALLDTTATPWEISHASLAHAPWPIQPISKFLNMSRNMYEEYFSVEITRSFRTEKFSRNIVNSIFFRIERKSNDWKFGWKNFIQFFQCANGPTFFYFFL